MKTILLPVLSVLVLWGCTVDYQMKPTNVDEPNRLVINSFLSPENPVCVYFHTIDRTAEGFVYRAAENLHVKLMEDDRILFDGLCADSVLALEHHPMANATYRIEVALSGYESVRAETTVPSAITCKASAEPFEPRVSDDFTIYSDMKYLLSDFAGEYEQENTSLYVQVYNVLTEDALVKSNSLYASNVLVDPFNRSNGIRVMDSDTGSSYYEYFMRVKNRNIPYLDRLIFIANMFPNGHYEYDFENWTLTGTWIPNVDLKKYLVKVIAAGHEYDMYFKNYYQQTTYASYDDVISSFFYQPIPVYSNINGGLGIFAGMNETNYYFDVPGAIASSH